MIILPYQPEWARPLAELFHAAVHDTPGRHYTAEQREAWAPTPPDHLRWAERLVGQRSWCAFEGEELAGFITLEAGGCIDLLYVHPRHQRRGVADRLYRHLEELARSQGLRRLSVMASQLAQPFFARRGFVVQAENRLVRRGVELCNVRMEKILGPET